LYCNTWLKSLVFWFSDHSINNVLLTFCCVDILFSWTFHICSHCTFVDISHLWTFHICGPFILWTFYILNISHLWTFHICGHFKFVDFSHLWTFSLCTLFQLCMVSCSMIKEVRVSTTLEFSGTLEFFKRFLILSHTPSLWRGSISKNSFRYTFQILFCLKVAYSLKDLPFWFQQPILHYISCKTIIFEFPANGKDL